MSAPRKFDWDEAAKLYSELRNYSEVARRMGVTVGSVRYALLPDQREHEKTNDRASKGFRSTCPACGGVAANKRPSRAGHLCRNCQRVTYSITPAGIAALAEVPA